VKLICKIFLLCIICIFLYQQSNAQLNITSSNNAQALVQKLLGPGVTVSNITLRADPLGRGTGFFNNISGTLIGIDSGIALTNGRAATIGSGPTALWGLNSDGSTRAYPPPNDAFADLDQYGVSTYSGDPDLASLIGLDSTDTHDACILEFDFVPLGDTIKFRYVFSSEEYLVPDQVAISMMPLPFL
jgi:hypothetical protein